MYQKIYNYVDNNRKKVVIYLLIFQFLFVTFSMLFKFKANDEIRHYRYGAGILHLDADRGDDDSKMPVTALNALLLEIPHMKFKKIGYLPIKIRVRDAFHSRAYLLTARMPTVLFSTILAFFVFLWSMKLFGYFAGLFSLLLYTFSPLIIGWSRLITTDIYSAAAITISLYFFWRFLDKPSWRTASVSALVLGVAQLFKYTSVYLYPLFFVIVLIKYLPEIRNNFKKALGTFVKYAGYFAVFTVLIINIGFLFYKTFTPLKDYDFQSNLFNKIKSIDAINSIPIPLPLPFVQGLDRVKYRERSGFGYSLNYLFGEVKKKGEGILGYYFFALAFKMPIALQIFLLMSIVIYFMYLKSYKFKNELQFIIVPVLFFTIYFNFFYKAQMGIRHMIVIYPLAHVFCGIIINRWSEFSLKWKKFTYAMLAYLIISVVSFYPHYISYTNEFILDKKLAYRYIAGSCLDFHQNMYYLIKYQQKHPNIHVNPTKRVAGRVVVEVNWLTGQYEPFDFRNNRDYRWLKDNFTPVDHIAHSYLVYDISEEDLKKIQ